MGLFLILVPDSELETEPTEPGPLGKSMSSSERKVGDEEFNMERNRSSVCRCFRLQGGAVSLHPTLFRPPAMQTVSQQPLLLQVRRDPETFF